MKTQAHSEEELKELAESVIKSEWTSEQFRTFFKEFFFGGYSTYEDFVKYDEAFVNIETKEVRSDVMNI